MITKLIGMKEFRMNLAAYTNEVIEGKARIILLKKNKPVLEINPIVVEEFTLEALKKNVREARKQVKSGKVTTLAEIKKKLNL